MHRPTRRATSALVLAAAFVGGGLATAPAARAAEHVITAVGISFPVADITIAEGDSLTFVNLDGPIPHDVTSGTPNDDPGGDFSSETVIATGSPTPVNGVEALASGTYEFFCTVHPEQMTGTLTVEGGEGDQIPVPVPVLPEAPLDGVVSVGSLVPTPTSITAHDPGDGDRLYVASWAAGIIFEVTLAEGVPLTASPYATGLSSPLGVAFGPGGILYVADSHPAPAGSSRTVVGRVTAFPPGGGDLATAGGIVVDNLPNGRHNTNGMEVRGGRLFVTNGNSTDDGVEGGEPELPLSGTLISIDLASLPEGGHVLDAGAGTDPDGDEDGFRVEATGMRNDYDVAFDGDGDFWITMNGLDMQDPYGEDLLLRGTPGGDVEDFGFPGCQYAAEDTEPQQNTNPAVTDVCGADHVPPEALLGLHTSADGLAFGPSGEGRPWDGDIFVARFGNFFGTTPVGHDIVRVPIDGDGNVAGPPVTFLLGPAPLDLTFGSEGMYVADFTGLILFVPDEVGALLLAGA